MAADRNRTNSKFYSLTRSGLRQSDKELASWTRLSSAINLVVEEA
jgi:PadR family transcriptional regulator, regulatory protein PadR